MKILIADDSTTDVALIRGILSDYEPLVAYDGMEAMKRLEENPDIDILILDINMPRMNGFEVLEALRERYEYRNIATLILTNYDEIDNEMRGLDLGAVDYIRKPLNIRSLRKRVELHIKLKNARDELELQNNILERTVRERTRESVLTDLAPENWTSYNVRKERKKTNKGAERRWQERITPSSRSSSSCGK